MATKQVDVLIVGGGPAGLTAGLYTARARLNTIIIERGRPGGQITNTTVIENWPGTMSSSGAKLTEAMAAHARHFGCQVIKDEVTELDFSAGEKTIRTKKQDEYVAKAVILAPGAEPRVLGIKGEKEFRGRGVSYCATCDADFYIGARVVVIGNGDAAVEEALYLAGFADEVTLVVVHDEGILDATRVIQERAFANPRIKFKWNAVLEEIKGGEAVEAVVIKDIKTGALQAMPADGVFFFVGTVPNTAFLRDQVELDEHGYIVTDTMMATSVDGVYAAGDCRQKFLRQVVTAAADGAIAAVMAEKYISEEDLFRKHILQEERPVLLAFWSPLEEASLPAVAAAEKAQESFKEQVKFIKIDTYRNQRAGRRYGINKVPAVLILKRGEVAARLGDYSPEAISRALADHLS
jgi:thioredoxin reductase (NADPH)